MKRPWILAALTNILLNICNLCIYYSTIYLCHVSKHPRPSLADHRYFRLNLMKRSLYYL
jgi:hypothetical protein